MAAVIENRLGSYEKRKEQVRRYELFIETNHSTGDTNKKPRLEIESKKSKYKIRFPDGCVFLAACSSGSTEDVAELLKNPNTDINTTNVDGLTGLHQACINEDIDMVKFLVDKGIDINTRDNEGWTALHAAAQSGFIEIAKFLISHGARLDLINCDCELPLDLSQTKSMTQLLEEAMRERGIDRDRARNAEESLMMEDIRKWSCSGIYEGFPDERTGATPLHVAAVKGYLDIMKHLIQLGAPVNAVDNEGWTPMHGAAHWGQEDACRLLAEHYCDLSGINNQGNTPLDVADPNVVGLLEELLEKQKSLPENSNVTRPSSKIRKSSITRISAGQMKDLQRKNEEDEKPPMMPNLPVSEDDDSFGDSDQNKTVAKVRPIEEEGQTGDGQVVTQMEANKFQDREFEGTKADIQAATERSDNKPEEVLSEDRIQFLLEERKRKLGQQRASDSNVVIMRREVPRPKSNSEYLYQISRPRMIASDLMRRSGDPSLWRLAYRRSSNSENDVEGLVELSEERIKKESGETDEDKELRRIGEHPPDTHQPLEPIEEVELPSNQQSSLLRPETAAALASIASSHQSAPRSIDNAKRDDGNELERKLKAKRARESRRSTQGVTKEDIQRAEDTLKAAYQGQSKINTSSVGNSTLPNPEGGSGDVDGGQNSSVPHAHPASESQGGGMIDSSVATIIEKWQKKDGEIVVKADPRASVGSRGSLLVSPALHKKDYSPETLILYRKISDQSQDIPQTEEQQVPVQPLGSQSKEGDTGEDPGEDPVVKMAASRSRRKRESRRSTGKISLEGADIQLSDAEEADESEQLPLQTTSESHPTASTHPEISSVSSLPKAVPSTTSLPLTSTSNAIGRFSSTRFTPDPTSVSPNKISNLPSRDYWPILSSSRQPNVRSSAILSSYDSPSSGQNFRIGNTGTNSAMVSVDYQKLWEQEKLETESLKKRNAQLERDLRNAQLQIDVSTPSKGFDRTDSREKRGAERKLAAELQEEKKLLEIKLGSLEEELRKVEPLKTENTKLKNENAALIRVISKLSK